MFDTIKVVGTDEYGREVRRFFPKDELLPDQENRLIEAIRTFQSEYGPHSVIEVKYTR